MKKTILHTPEGVRDIYNEEIEKRGNEALSNYGIDKYENRRTSNKQNFAGKK